MRARLLNALVLPLGGAALVWYLLGGVLFRH